MTAEEIILLDCRRRDLSQKRIDRYMDTFRKLAKAGVDLDNLNQAEADKFYFYIKGLVLEDWTKATYWIIFKRMCRVLKAEIDLSLYKFKIKEKVPILLTDEEVWQMISAANNIQHKIFIMLLYESGCRLGELMDLRKQDITFDKDGAVMHINGKTGPRPVRIVKYAKNLFCYSNFFDSAQRLFEATTHKGFQEYLKELAKRVGITKRVYPHLFRHMRATFMAKHCGEMEMRKIFGWSKSSDMPSTYVHLTEQDIDEKVLKINGLLKEAGA